MVINILAGSIIGVFLVLTTTYNKLVRLRNVVKEGCSGFDVQLKRCAALIPSLVETVKGNMQHKRNLLSEIKTALSKALVSLMAVAEGLSGSEGQSELHLPPEGTYRYRSGRRISPR